MPSGNDSAASAAEWIASRVFPVPPGPVSVSSLAPSCSSDAISATSRSRPRNVVAGTGRFVRYSDLRGGNAVAPSW